MCLRRFYLNMNEKEKISFKKFKMESLKYIYLKHHLSTFALLVHLMPIEFSGSQVTILLDNYFYF